MNPATTPRVRRWLPYLGALILIGLIIAGLWPKPVPVETARATVGAIRATVNEEGKTRIKQRYLISAPVAGQLRRIPFKAGAVVKAGETVLAVIDPLAPTLLDARTRTTAEARRDSAAANLEKTGFSHVFAASELRRFEKLYADKTVSVQELETAQMREATAAKEEAAAQSALRQAEAELAEFSSPNAAATNTLCPPTEVKAPVNGRVLRVFEENARVVSAGTPLVEVGDPTELEVVVEVLSRDGAAIPPGAKVEFDHWGGTEPLLGQVRLVEPAAFTKVSALGVEEQRVNVIADLTTPPEQRRNVGDNFRVEARIIIWETDNALKVPAGALFRRGEDWAAFVVVEGRARLRVVKAGRSSGTETQILVGLKEGEEVVLYPGSRVQDGQPVKQIKI
ncbi:MAG TPA: efflux RND transporter periplasmic adaptor subunit [Candidatus Binatia bacterium]|jgi:HlyD family secretion protein|nr:efflux RND transporter periplasmic adaptor subunit [Candidatus Binatia bacterium]